MYSLWVQWVFLLLLLFIIILFIDVNVTALSFHESVQKQICVI